MMKLEVRKPLVRWGAYIYIMLFLLCDSVGAVVIDRVVAVVNKEIVTQSELEEAALARRQEGISVSSKDLLNEIIEKRLRLQSARKRGVRIADHELRLALEDIKQRNGFEDDTAFQQALVKEGVSWGRYVEGLREELILLKLFGREVDSNLVVTEEELLQYYEENKERFLLAPRVRISQIFLGVSSDAAPQQVEEVQMQAQKIEALLAKEGRDFSLLAEEYGEGPERHLGGDIGYFQKGDLAPAIEQVILPLNEGEVSKVLRGPTGFRIFKVIERTTSAPQPFDQVRSQVEEVVVATKREALQQQWLSGLWENAHMEIK